MMYLKFFSRSVKYERKDECGSGSVSGQSCAISRSESKLMAGEKRRSDEFGEKHEFGRKRVKVRDLESVLRSKGIDTHCPKSLENKEANDPFLSAEKEISKVTKETVTVNSNTLVILQHLPNKSSSGKHDIEHDVNFVTSRGFGWDLNAEDVSSSLNQDAFYPYKNHEHLKTRDASECGSTTGPLEEKDPMRVWKEMKQNGFLSSSHGGIPMPKPRGRKSKNDGLKKKMELAKREQVDRFAKIAAPSGLLTELNPGIINHVRNGKQVHSIIEALVKSEKRENRHAGSKPGTQTKSGTKEIRASNDLENVTGTGNSQPSLSHKDGSLNTLSGSGQTRGCAMSLTESVYLNSQHTGGDGDSSMVERRAFGTSFYPSHSNPESEDDILALKLSSSTTMASEITSSLSNDESANLTSVNSLSVEAANVASQWLELLHQDIRGRLSALRRSKKRVRAVIHTELPFLMSREFSSNQENDPYLMKNSTAGCFDNATADVHPARWSTLFDQMDKALSEEEKQLESWLNQLKEMQLHCERGLQNFQHNAMHGLQQLGTLEDDSRSEKAEKSERELAVRAAAASIYSTCNFLLSMENLPCF
ncbi:hypothetical protein F0562_026382 [Nyssa sinensis]|uniref:Uncharacterized protein n=1 Tax=Nyssa sinensis TaxID=561372 RepID=A0A5J5BB40_9ASTE|nr:hypothetical protein F0562_026382 [Nyssa sinensis]